MRQLLLAAIAVIALVGALAVREHFRQLEPTKFVLPDAAVAAAVGAACPAVSLPDRGGVDHDLCGARGQFTMINFWTSWCGPCLAEMDLLIETLREYEARDVRYVSVCLATPDSCEYIMGDLPASHVALDATDAGENVSSRFGNVGTHVPFDVLIAPDGTIAATRHGSFGDAASLRSWLDGEIARFGRR